jgi:hypothetical protein
LRKQAEVAMDGEITIPRTLQTDGVVAAAAKRERGSGNPRRFESQLRKERKSSDEPDQKAEADKPADDKAGETPSESPPSAAVADQDRLLDFEA